MTVGEVKFR